jgi:hypothetical protein
MGGLATRRALEGQVRWCTITFSSMMHGLRKGARGGFDDATEEELRGLRFAEPQR